MTPKLCKKCGSPTNNCGFERKLIVRGKDKGKSYVKEFYCCSKGY